MSNMQISQRQSADALLAMLPQRKYTHVLDAGCGPGWMSRHWRERHAQVTALDLSPPMLVQARQKDAADHYLAGDIESLPLATATFDLAWSNLAVQWCGNLSTALRELYRVVRPQRRGRVYHAGAGDRYPNCIRRGRRWTSVRMLIAFLPPDEIEQSLNGVHYQHHIQPITLWFDDALSAMRSLKGIGATHLHEGRDPRILTRSQLQRLQLALAATAGAISSDVSSFFGSDCS